MELIFYIIQTLYIYEVCFSELLGNQKKILNWLSMILFYFFNSLLQLTFPSFNLKRIFLNLFSFIFVFLTVEHVRRALGRWILVVPRDGDRGWRYDQANVATLCHACIPIHHPSGTWSAFGNEFNFHRFINH